MDIKDLQNRAKQELEGIKNLAGLDEFFRKYLGKNGEIAEFFAQLKSFAEDERKKLGQEANIVKQEIEKIFQEKSEAIKNDARWLKLKQERIDVTRPAKKIERGHLHPLTLVQEESCQIFQGMGFEVVEGPELETEWYNFDALNIPADHPAREMQDTFWLRQKVSTQNSKLKSQKSGRLLLRTQTSAVQVRYMEKHNPPLRIVVPGRVFRNEATDASHEAQFYQIEGLMVGHDISAANFKAVIQEFFKRFFQADVKIRLRPSFFPFTEPSFEIDVQRQGGKWLELMGAGMVNPNVYKAAGLDPKDPSTGSGQGWQGFAFGVGVDRLAMVKYKINDIRLFYQNDLRFLRQF